jgi:hypothetical protein
MLKLWWQRAWRWYRYVDIVLDYDRARERAKADIE